MRDDRASRDDAAVAGSDERVEGQAPCDNAWALIGQRLAPDPFARGQMVTSMCSDHVGAIAAQEVIGGAVAGIDAVRARSALERVAPAAAVQHVMPGAAVQHVVPAPPM